MLCACKHIAQARVLMLESQKGYEEHYFFALGHLAEAEDELLKDHGNLCIKLREERKNLEEDKTYRYPFTKIILFVAHEGEEKIKRVINEIETEFSEKSLTELRTRWVEVQRI